MSPPKITSPDAPMPLPLLGQATATVEADVIRETVPSRLGTRFCVAMSSAFGLGLSPFAPGTFGTLLGVLIHIIALSTSSTGSVVAPLVFALAAVSLAHWLLTPFAVDYWQDPDPSHFVLDEVAGYLVVALMCPFMTTWYAIAGGFLLFRVLDIFKPPPARQIDRDWNGAAGILCDDLVSGAYAGGVMWLLWLTARAAGLSP